jgi:hypothetical protein
VLARSVDCALRSLEESDPVPIRAALAATDAGSVAAMVNAANAYALLFRRSPGGRATRDLTSAIALMRLAGLEVGMRRDILDDPVLRLLQKRKEFRALANGWGLGAVSPYSTLEAIGPDAAALLLQWYPTELKLLQAARRNPQVVATRGESGLDEVPWWVGALEWMVAGRDVAVINAYQAAGIRDATQAGRIGDAQVVWRLKVRQEDDTTLAIPDARTRALMAATT